MADFLGVDPAISAAKTALEGLGQRQQVISRNIANVDTPGYQAQTYSFEDSLKAAMQPPSNFQMVVTDEHHIGISHSTPTPMVGTSARTGGSERADGNNVDVDVELTDMAETGIRYQALTQSASKKLALLKSIASAR